MELCVSVSPAVRESARGWRWGPPAAAISVKGVELGAKKVLGSAATLYSHSCASSAVTAKLFCRHLSCYKRLTAKLIRLSSLYYCSK